MTKDKIKLIKIITFSLAGLTFLIGGGYLLISSWNQPFNQALTLPTEPIGDVGIIETQDSQTDEHPPSEPGTLTPTIEPVCGGPPSLNILISGVSSNSYLYGLADAIRIARVDFQTKEVFVLALPRDLWVQIPGLESRGIDAGKINHRRR